jgi:hypothetical protein
VLDDQPLADRGPALDAIVIAIDHDRAITV